MRTRPPLQSGGLGVRLTGRSNPRAVEQTCPRSGCWPLPAGSAGRAATGAARPLHSRLGLDPLAQEFLRLGYPGVPLGQLLRGQELLHPLADGPANLFELRDRVGSRDVGVLGAELIDLLVGAL